MRVPLKEKKLADVLLVEINAIAPLVMAQVLETSDGLVLVFIESVEPFVPNTPQADEPREKRRQVDLAKATVRGFSAGVSAVLAVQKVITDKAVADLQKEVRGR